MAVQVDEAVARALGWPKLKYADLERERRWLCNGVPAGLTRSASRIVDLYVTGARLRLREEVPLDGGEPIRRLTRKGDVDASTRLLTSIYLTEGEFALLDGLPGRRIAKTRWRLHPPEGAIALVVDRFEAPLQGLCLAEAEFADDLALAAFAPPAFLGREITSDERYRGSSLALHGVPIPP
jgi:CYTH domain-containing protein